MATTDLWANGNVLKTGVLVIVTEFCKFTKDEFRGVGEDEEAVYKEEKKEDRC